MLTTQSIDPNDPHQRRFFLWRWIVNVWHWIVPPTQAHADRESQHTRVLRASLIIGVFLSVVVVCLSYSRPIYNFYKTKRAESLIKDARRFADNGDAVTAVMTAQEAYRISPDYEPGIRLNAQLLTSFGAGYSQKALYFWDKLGKQGAASLEDMQGMVRALLRSGREKEARQELENLLKEHPNDTATLKLAQEVWGQQQTTAIVMKVMKEYSAKNPDDKDAALRLAKFMLSSGASADITLARENLWTLADSDEEAGIEALRGLADQSDLDLDERKKLAARLQSHPQGNGWDKTKALSLLLSMQPDERHHLIEQTARQFDGKRGEDLLPFVRWLVENKEFARVLTLLDEAAIKRRKEDQPLLLNYLTALTMTGRIPELERLVNDKEVLLQPSVRAMYQAHLGLIKGADRETMKRLLNAARVTAMNDGSAELLFQIAAYCTDKLHDFYDVAEECYSDLTGAVSRQRLERPAHEGFVNCARLAGHTDVLSKAALRAAERWPDDKSFQEIALYVNLIRGDAIETTLERAVRLLDASPDDAMRKIVCAFGFYRLGDLESAVKTLQDTNLKSLANTRTSAFEGPSIIFATIVSAAGPQLVANGDIALFNRQLASIIAPIQDTAPLLPEERRMLIALRAQIAAVP